MPLQHSLHLAASGYKFDLMLPLKSDSKMSCLCAYKYCARWFLESVGPRERGHRQMRRPSKRGKARDALPPPGYCHGSEWLMGSETRAADCSIMDPVLGCVVQYSGACYKKSPTKSELYKWG